MSTSQIHFFISHSWAYSGHDNTLSDWIFNRKDARDFRTTKRCTVHAISAPMSADRYMPISESDNDS